MPLIATSPWPIAASNVDGFEGLARESAVKNDSFVSYAVGDIVADGDIVYGCEWFTTLTSLRDQKR